MEALEETVGMGAGVGIGVEAGETAGVDVVGVDKLIGVSLGYLQLGLS